eukprot:c18698_g1_i3.p1 GENE.c18698_g1_i3~~c18698_g1_i3.p1  ORF type:complete len:262 (+),score=49.04 c18698_g1_i3:613-1398(+)
MMDSHTKLHGYKEVSVPLIVSRSTLTGTGHLPKFEDDLFQTNHNVGGENSFLIPTGEVPLTALLRGRILEESELPYSFVTMTPCFRAEAGSHGRDTRGLMRQHQFPKVELVRVAHPESSHECHLQMIQHSQQILKSLELPYRTVQLCSGDLGFSAAICYDLEVYLPSQGRYREIASISNCSDFQAARLGIRFKPQGSKSTQWCHTLNGSGVAVGRALIAVLETNHKPDGSVTVPKVLVPYMGGTTSLQPAKPSTKAKPESS